MFCRQFSPRIIDVFDRKSTQTTTLYKLGVPSSTTLYSFSRTPLPHPFLEFFIQFKKQQMPIEGLGKNLTVFCNEVLQTTSPNFGHHVQRCNYLSKFLARPIYPNSLRILSIDEEMKHGNVIER